jgi:dethiobiotin synthetase
LKRQQPSFFVTGTGTEVGKTLVSAILTEKLQADYWKPIQAGDLHDTDSMKVARWVSNEKSHFHKEAYALATAASPHYAAERDGLEIRLKRIQLPATDNRLIVEGAGGLMVPLNPKRFIIDLIEHLKLPVILVSRNYLGSINHTLLSVEALQRRNLPIAGIIFNGGGSLPSAHAIAERVGRVPILGHIPHFDAINQSTIQAAGQYIAF